MLLLSLLPVSERRWALAPSMPACLHRLHVQGANFNGQLGIGEKRYGESTANTTFWPVGVLTKLKFKAVGAGQWSTCALTGAGVPHCW